MVATLQLRESVASDWQLVELWVFGKSQHTARYYRCEAGRFLKWVEKPLVKVTLADLQFFASWLAETGLGLSSQGRSPLRFALSPSIIANQLAIFSGISSFAIEV